MKNAYEIVMENRKELVNSIIENMKKGYIWSPEPWDSKALRPYNPTSHCYYLGGNRVRLMMAAIQNNYSDPRWCTFDQAKNNGWAIQRGAKSVLLEKWIFTEKKTVENARGEKVQVEEPLEKPKVSYFRVFNAAQIHGIPELNVKADPEMEKIAKALLKSSECDIVQCGEEAYYSPKSDRITLPSRYAFKSTEAFLSVAAHEMSHSTGHESRLNRPFISKFGTPDYAREELRAELGSALLKCDLQLSLSPEQLQDHSNYLSSWMKILQKDPNEFFRACRDAEKISTYLYQNYEKTLETEKFITADLEANNLKPEGGLTHKMRQLFEKTGKNLTLNEINKLANQPQTISASQEITLAKEIIALKELSEECLAGMEAADYEWIETPPESLGTVTFRHTETGELVSSDGWEGIRDYLQEINEQLKLENTPAYQRLNETVNDMEDFSKERLANLEKGPVTFQDLDMEESSIPEQNTFPPSKMVQTETPTPIDPFKFLRIITDLTDNNFKSDKALVKNIYTLCQHTGKELTLREIAIMAKCPPADPTSRELITEIANECCRQELQIQAMNELAAEPM